MYFYPMTHPTDITMKTWTRLIRAYQVAISSVENSLKSAGLPPLSWYDVLLELERADGQKLRPFELERALLLPQYGISRLVERIEKAGYLKSEVCEDDGRGKRLVITSEGKKLRKRMWAIYGPAIDEAVGKKLSDVQANSLSSLLAQLLE